MTPINKADELFKQSCIASNPISKIVCPAEIVRDPIENYEKEHYLVPDFNERKRRAYYD